MSNTDNLPSAVVIESTSKVPHEPKYTPPAPPVDVTGNNDDFKAQAYLDKVSAKYEAAVLATHTPAPKNSSQTEAFDSCKGASRISRERS